MRKILGSIWFTEMGNPKSIGIVVVDNGFEKKAYIGTGEGFNQELDEDAISQKGAKFPIEVAKIMGIY